MNKQENNLTDEEFKDFNNIITETLKTLIDYADNHNIDRDSFVKYFARIFGTMAEISTFSHYETLEDIQARNEVFEL